MKLLTEAQKKLLAAVGRSELGPRVYFTGGTLLACHYLEHRRSEDLDFFSPELLDNVFVAQEMRAIAKKAGVTAMRYVKFPSRWQYFLTLGGDGIKLDIVYYPFPALGKHGRLPAFHLTIDSLRDIAVNKVHACFEREAPRDAFDLFTIMRQKGWRLETLIKDVERKFGVIIDPAHLIARLNRLIDRMDEIRPLFVQAPPDPQKIKSFFRPAAKRFLGRRLK